MSTTSTSSQVTRKEGGERLSEFSGRSRGRALASSYHSFPTDTDPHKSGGFYNSFKQLYCYIIANPVDTIISKTLTNLHMFPQQAPSQKPLCTVDWWDQRSPASSASSSETSESATGSGTKEETRSSDSRKRNSTRSERSRWRRSPATTATG